MFMDQEDVSDTGLALRLGYGGTAPHAGHHRQRNRGSPLSNPTPFEPSLTLSLSDDAYVSAKPKAESNREGEERRPGRPSSPHSALSSFSAACPVNVKRERDTAAEEVEAERVSSRVSDDDDEGGARKKLRLSKEQSAFLEDRFKEQSTLNPKQKQALARQLSLRPRQVEVWFQNRRARTKLKQTEVDCEFLKRCCETLTAENRRLQKELQELRGLKFAPPTSLPLYMQLPAATLTMCPSCEGICGGGDGSQGGGDRPFAVPPKPHFFNPFAHPAAC